MLNDVAAGEVKDVTQRPEISEYKEIKPESTVDFQTCKTFWDNLFCSEASGEAGDASETEETDDAEKNLEQTLNEYFEDLKDKSECPETIPDRPFEAADLEKLPPDEVAKCLTPPPPPRR